MIERDDLVEKIVNAFDAWHRNQLSLQEAKYITNEQLSEMLQRWRNFEPSNSYKIAQAAIKELEKYIKMVRDFLWNRTTIETIEKNLEICKNLHQYNDMDWEKFSNEFKHKDYIGFELTRKLETGKNNE